MKILAFAYACEPGKGSEPGAGWGWAKLLARMGETWIITRTNNRDAIESELSSTPEAASLHFVYVDLSARARWWKRGQRGIHLYYMLWQWIALRRGRALHEELDFDLVWHLTLSTVWTGSLAASVGPPFIWGPVGGGLRPPWRLVPALGVHGAVSETIRAAVQLAGRYANPVSRIAWRKARVILVQNPGTRDWLPRRHRGKTFVFPHVLADVTTRTERAPSQDPPTALFVGRLVPWKGVAIAIRAIAEAHGWQLIVVGKGSDDARLHRLVRRLGVGDRVRFLGWLERDDVLTVMRDHADVFLFPSLREEAGWVIVEALSSGLPVICLDRGGPPILAGAAAMTASSSRSSGGVTSEIAGLLARGGFPERPAMDEQLNAFTPGARLEALRGVLSV